MNHYLHAASKAIIDLLVKQGVGTLIVGKNPLWKQGVRMGKRNNQNFVQIPHARFIDMLTYKAALVGIQVELQEESYTSKASFLDLERMAAEAQSLYIMQLRIRQPHISQGGDKPAPLPYTGAPYQFV